MQKELFQILALSGLLTLAFFVGFFLYSKDDTFFVNLYHEAERNHSLVLMAEERIQELVKMKIDQMLIHRQNPTNKPLVPCPDKPPNLVGPFKVDYDFTRTMDEVKKKIDVPLQKGGRYKPPDCISRHKVAVIIPFRNRHEHLKQWLYFVHPILIRQQLDYGIYVINQYGDGVFNRAKLMNVGYAEALKQYDYKCFVFSDVDLIPLDDRNIYRCFDNPRHLSVAVDKFNYRLPYNTIFGGVAALSKSQFLKINGFPNSYWGWGGEDDDVYKRIIYHGMSLSRPDMTTGRYKMIKHVRDKHNNPNPKNALKLQQTRWTMDKDGLNSLKYTVKEIVKEPLYTFVTVDIEAPPG
ncbi:beta-1,4-galactosyltransferase 1-like [Scomber scombrus]|nr:beta-1,4-galactosyltransferase 1-like [Scomber scombrus]